MKLYTEEQVREAHQNGRNGGHNETWYETDDYLNSLSPIELPSDEEQCVEFVKWIAKAEWMSIWVEDKWMWECQLENSNTTYKTEEELYQMYLSIQGGNK